MVKVLPAIFSYEDMKSKWNQDNPDNPYSRRDELQQGIYSLDKWLIRVDDENRSLATIGWKEYPSHTVVGGLLATHRANKKRPEYEGDHLGKNERALQSAREPQLNQSKPLVAAFGAREGSSEAWIQRGRDRGWVFSQDEKFNQVKSLVPESVINEWNGAYPNGNWAIRQITDAESLSKWVFIDDPTPSWFNLLKYLPDNSWDDFELGEPAPDLGTRDRFKDKNIKSRGKAEYKAFVSQQYLRQVSDRIPNAGTSLMQGWLEKLTEMNLKKGKYWFFGRNVKQDNTYVMIDVIKQGEPYTANAGKKLNLEGFETAIIFTGVSKEMVGKVKRGQGIPKGRKFLDIHGKYGVRGLRRGRRLPKEPKNIFQTFEKSWKDILKILPDSTFNTMLDDTDNETEIISTARHDKDNPHGYSSEHNIAFRPHYLERAQDQRIADHPDAKRTDLLPELADKIRAEGLKVPGWAYLTDNPEDFAYITFAPFPANYNEGTDMLSSSSSIAGKDKNKFDRQSIWRNPLKKVLIFLDSVRPTTQSYPLSSFNTFYNIWGTGIKKGHEGGDYAGHSEHIKDDKAKQKRREDAEQQFAEAFARRTDYQKAELAYKNWMNQTRIADIRTERGDRETFTLTRKEHLKNLKQIQTLGIDKFAKNMINARTENRGLKEKKKVKMAVRIERVVAEYKKFLMNLKEADDREQARLRDLKEIEENKKKEE